MCRLHFVHKSVTILYMMSFEGGGPLKVTPGTVNKREFTYLHEFGKTIALKFYEKEQSINSLISIQFVCSSFKNRRFLFLIKCSNQTSVVQTKFQAQMTSHHKN